MVLTLIVLLANARRMRESSVSATGWRAARISAGRLRGAGGGRRPLGRPAPAGPRQQLGAATDGQGRQPSRRGRVDERQLKLVGAGIVAGHVLPGLAVDGGIDGPPPGDDEIV